jgi:hypothetical protein
VGFREDELEQLEVYRRAFLRLVSCPNEHGERQQLTWHAGVVIEEVDLAGEYPQTVLVITFHKASRPGCRFTWYEFLWRLPLTAPDEPTLADIGVDFIEYVDMAADLLQRLPCGAEPHPLGSAEARAVATG